MTSKQAPGKVTLGMLKGKPITTSVPVIRYRASDDEVEELYPSTDDDELYTPESEHPSTKSSPCKTSRNKSEDESGEGNLGRRSASVDGNLSEGTPPSDPWKMLSEIKGKITKTFEEKISEIKSERKKKKKRRSRDNSSVSDSEDFADNTPTEDNLSEHQDADISSPIKFSKNRSARFTGFYNIKTGLKTKNSEEDSVESGVEAAEFAKVESAPKNPDSGEKNDVEKSTIAESKDGAAKPETQSRIFSLDSIKMLFPGAEAEPSFSQLVKLIIYQLLSLPVILWGVYHTIPLPEYFVGLIGGIIVMIMIQRVVVLVTGALMTPQKVPLQVEKEQVSVLEIPAVEEYASLDRFEGWLNQLPYSYDPDNYHVARTISVYFRLEGGILKVMETKTRIPKREIWDEPKQKVRFIWKKIWTLADASVELLPEGLIRRRRWSKKYPICLTFGKDALIESSSLNEISEDEFLQKVDVDEDGTIHEEDETDDDLSKDSKDLKDTFEDCSDENGLKSKMYIFARTDRQKEDWFRRLIDAINLANKRSSVPSINETVSSSPTSAVAPGGSENKNSVTSSGSLELPSELSYNTYMARYIESTTNAPSDSETREKSDVVWMNALVGRILFDLHKCPETISLIQDRIQRKMSNIKLPYFMESLVVSELVIGQGAPVIHKASQPILDQRGLWLELDVSHEGCLTMTIETKINLMKLTKGGSVSSNSTEMLTIDKPKPARSPIFDSDVEDSPETSTEEEDNTNVAMPSTSRDSTPTQSSGRKFLNMVDKLAANKYFQHATEIRYIRRAMEGFSNTEIRLMVTVSSIEGCLVLNVPPPPSDRLWYGFKTVPKINLTAKPALGEKQVNIVYITSLIENKLLREFEKLVVLPNMDDLMIPLCPNYPYTT